MVFFYKIHLNNIVKNITNLIYDKNQKTNNNMLRLTTYFKNINKIKLILILFWVGCIASINTNSIANEVIHYINSFNRVQLTTLDYIDYINFLRFFFPILILFILTIWFICIKKKIFLLLLLLLFYNLYQLIIPILKDNNLDIGDYQLVGCSISALLILYITACYNYQDLYKIFLHILLIFIALISIYFLFKIFNEFIKVKDLKYFYFSETITPESRNFNQANPRSTGIARMLIIIFYFLFFFKEKFDNKKIYFIYFLLFFTFMSIYALQARGALIGIPILIGYYIFFIKENFLKKFVILICIFILPIITFESILKFKTKYEAEKYKNRLVNNYTTSGRTEIWRNSINIIQEKKIIFGVGPRGDRKLLTEYLEANKAVKNFIVWENNSSNALIYSYLSGGIVCFFIIILIYLETLNKLYKSIFIRKIFITQDYLIHFSVITLFYLVIRSIYENSFTIFGIDFYFFIISHIYLFKNNLKKLWR